ncbi:MAG: hypothetical protein GY794_02690, partial [bacterium]|nr:hypothetical protein [bacterium]
MGRAVTTTSSDDASDAGTLVIMVLLAAIVPAGCVLWFLNAAVENQQLAVKQRLTDAYGSQFDARRDGLLSAWKKIEQKLDQARKVNDPGQIYKQLISGRVCSAIIVYDESGQVLYPRQLRVMNGDHIAHSDLWDKARRLEDDLENTASADLYAVIARKSDNIHLAARAMQGQIRCLVRTGQADRIGEAIDVITGPLSELKYRDALDSGGRMIVPAARLMALQLGGEKLSPELSSRLVRQLVERLWDDDDAIMSSSQRLFLIDQLRAIKPQAGLLKSDSDAAMQAYHLYWAQVHAARFLERDRPKVTGSLLPSGAAGLWAMASADNRVVALFTDSQVESIIQEVCD